MFEHLHELKVLAQVLNDLKTIALSKAVADQGVHPHFTIIGQAFKEQIRSNSVFADLVEDLYIDTTRLSSLDVDLASQVSMQIQISLVLI